MRSNNRKLTLFLILLLIGVWGSIAYQLLGSSNSSEAEPNSDSALDRFSSQTTPIKYEYIANVRDPFSLPAPIKKKEIHKNAIAPLQIPNWTPPPFKLTGIIINERKRTAMLENSDGLVYFLKEGDSIKGVRIQKIDQTNVSYVYLNGKGNWQLEK